MRPLFLLLLLLLSLPGVPSRAEEAPAAPPAAPPAAEAPDRDLGNIWCLGDSWSVCYNGANWRRPLCQALAADGRTFDFVGTFPSDPGCEAAPDYDPDHNAIGGVTARRVRQEYLDTWLRSVRPDIVLILLGGNDVTARPDRPLDMLADLRGIIDRIRADNPRAAFHVGMYGYVDVNVPDAGADLMAVALASMVAAAHTPESPVYLVDHRVGWDKSRHLDPVDKFHPNPEGMAHMARRWHASLAEHHAPPYSSSTIQQPTDAAGSASDSPGQPST